MEKADGYSNGAMFDCTWRGENISFNQSIMSMKIDKDKEETRLGNMESRPPTGVVARTGNPRWRTDLQPEILETAPCLWRIRGMYICTEMERADVL